MVKVVFSDDRLMVLDKPPGLVVTSSETQPFDYTLGKKLPTLEDILRDQYGIKAERSGIVHRLDKDTSGLLVAAKDDEALKSLQAQFKNREVKKEYVALVHGFVEKGGRVEGAIARNPGDREKFVVLEGEGARPAVTEYKPLELRIMSEELRIKVFEGFSKIQFKKLNSMNYERFTLLSCYPLTGRTHQIRVHLKYIGFPVVGDSKYGGRKITRLDHRWCPRQFLHAARLEFRHPGTEEKVKFESSLPEDLERALGVLEKADSNLNF